MKIDYRVDFVYFRGLIKQEQYNIGNNNEFLCFRIC